MRLTFAAMALAVAFAFAAPAGATRMATTPTVNAPHPASIIVAQRCRCVERRWNGSCKLRVCRDHW
ncbi:MAG TPA: hypothetical protein VII40_04265 [Xanthobacteraceae bacterium]